MIIGITFVPHTLIMAMKKSIFLLLGIVLICASFQVKKKKKAAPLPVCIQQLINKIKKEPVQNPPRTIYSYQYKKHTVYYVTPPCCDFFSEVFDSTCKLLGHPDGGFTGRGDGSLPDFNQEKSAEKLLWKDNR